MSVLGFGAYCRGIFAADYIAALDGKTEITGGFINHNYKQLALQFANAVAGFAYSFIVTFLILQIMDRFPCLRLRVSGESEDRGIDISVLQEYAYDYVRDKSDMEEAELNQMPAPTNSSADQPVSNADVRNHV